MLLLDSNIRCMCLSWLYDVLDNDLRHYNAVLVNYLCVESSQTHFCFTQSETKLLSQLRIHIETWVRPKIF